MICFGLSGAHGSRMVKYVCLRTRVRCTLKQLGTLLHSACLHKENDQTAIKQNEEAQSANPCRKVLRARALANPNVLSSSTSTSLLRASFAA